jgi:hypothetical protein
MPPLRLRVLAAVAFAAGSAAAQARPNLDAPRTVSGLTIYSDDARPGLFYYGPGALAVARDAEGRPDVHFLAVRYTGTAATADRGRTIARGLITFTVTQEAPRASAIDAARRALGVGALGAGAELRPLPIRRLDAALDYAAPGQVQDPTELPAGHFEDAEDAPQAEGAWTTRSYTLGLDAPAADLFGSALTKGQLVISVAYSFHAEGVDADGKEVKDRTVRASAFDVGLDVNRWPDLIRKVDLNERVPPDYPLLDVYCYDFRDALHPGLYEKQVEVEAEGVGGRPVSARVRFGQDQPDLYASGLRFRVAVRLDRPYRYRVTAVAADGTSTLGAWQARDSWNQLLDVTTPAAAGDRAGGE